MIDIIIKRPLLSLTALILAISTFAIGIMPVFAIDCNGTATAEDCAVETINTATGRYKTVIAGDGTYPSDSTGSLSLNVPACSGGPATIVRATISWAIRDASEPFWDDTINIDRDGGAASAIVQDIRYKTRIFTNTFSSYTADMTATGVVQSGSHVYNMTGLDTSGGGGATAQWGYGMHVIYECPEFPIVETVYKNGQDMHWSGWSAFPWAVDRSELICESFAAVPTPRTATLEMFLLGSASPNRQADIWYKTGTGPAPSPTAYDLLSDVITPANGGAVLARAVLGSDAEWDTFQDDTVAVPANHEYICIQVDSSFDTGTHPSNGSYKGASMFSGATWFSISSPVVADLSLGNLVWEDLNNDGIFNGAETGVCNVEVHLYIDVNGDGQYSPVDDGTTPLATATTACGGTAGEYEFTGLSADDYLVVIPSAEFGSGEPLEFLISSTGTNGSATGPSETAPDPDNDTNDDDNGTTQPGDGVVSAAITLSAGGEPITDGDADTDTNFSVDFGFFQPQRIGNQLFHDINNNGLFDAAEPGIQNVTVQLFEDVDNDGIFEPGGDDGAVVSTEVTDSNGRYWFENLSEADYFVVLPTAGNTSVTIGGVSGLNLGTDLINSTGQGLTNVTAGSFEPDTDLDIDNNDDGLDTGNGAIPAGYITISTVLTLAEGTEPAGEALPGGAVGDDETEANVQPGAVTNVDSDSNLTVDFGFTSLPDLAVTKSIDKDGDASFVQAEVINRPGVSGNPDPTTFQYEFVVENQSSLTNATGVEMTDILPPGVIAVSVDSVTAGSVTTPLPVTGAAGTGSPLVWNIGSHNAGVTHTLVLNVTLTMANTADFIAGFDAASASQNVAQISAMTEDDVDSVVNNASSADYGGVTTGFDPGSSEDDEDDARVSIPPALGNLVWLDANANGIQDGAEAGIPGVTVRIYQDIGPAGPDGGDTLVATAVTSVLGEYWFGNLATATNYYVQFDHTTVAASLTPVPINAGGDDAIDSDGDTVTGYTANYSLTPGEINPTVDMGYVSRPSLGDLVWLDVNDNGQQDGGEAGVPGVTVRLYEDDNGTPGFNPGDTLIDTQVTDGSGNYLFENLTSGVDYYVEFDHSTVAAGLTPSTQDTGSDTTDSDGDQTTGVTAAQNLSPAEARLTVDQGYVPHYSIGNRVWIDSGLGITNDGIQNGAEIGLNGVTVKLLDNTGTPIDDPNIVGIQDYDVVTDANGYYRFDSVLAGDYIVGIEAATLPANVIPSTGQSTTSTPDQRDHGADILVSGNYQSAILTVGVSAQPTDESDFGAGQGTESPYGNAGSYLSVDFGFVEVTDITVTKNVAPGIFTIGTTSTVTYTVEVTNRGPSDVAAATVVDSQPLYTSFTGWTCAVTSPGTGSLTEACANASGSGSIAETVTLNVGGVATYTITADINDSATTTVTNIATVALPGTSVQDPSNNDPDTDSADVLPQQQDASIILNKALYEDHDSGAQCNTSEAVDELIIVDKDKSVKDITYCFTVLNDGDTYLDTFTFVDAVLGITEVEMTMLPSDPIPLAPGDTLNFYYETTTDTSVNNTATIDARPVTPGGIPTGQPNVSYTDPTAVLIYVSDPPFGLKTGTLNGSDVITWDMIWINDSVVDANGVVISDEVPEGTTYHGNLSCNPEGTTTVASCIYESPSASYPRGRILVTADLSADDGASTAGEAENELVITFDVLLDNPSENRDYENQGLLEWDADNDGNVDFSILTDDPVPAGSSDPSVVLAGLAETGSGIYVQITLGIALFTFAVLQWRIGRED